MGSQAPQAPPPGLPGRQLPLHPGGVGGVNAGLQSPICPLCTIFSSCGFPVGIQSSFQGLWVGSHEQSPFTVAREHCGGFFPGARNPRA